MGFIEMNDFTKEDLERLSGLVWMKINELTVSRMMSNEARKILNDLYKKLQSMIDNYCEHEWDNYYSGSINTGIYCNKCCKGLKGS